MEQESNEIGGELRQALKANRLDMWPDVKCERGEMAGE